MNKNHHVPVAHNSTHASNFLSLGSSKCIEHSLCARQSLIQCKASFKHLHILPKMALSAHLLCATVAYATLAPGLYRPEMLLYPSKKKNQLSAPALQSEVLCTCVGVIATATSDLTDLAMGATGSKQSVAFDELEPSEWCARPARWRVSCGVCVFLMSLEQVRHQPAKPGRGIFGERMRGPVTVWCTCA